MNQNINRSMKIMMLNTLYSPNVVGGAEIIFQEQAEGFAKLGNEVIVVTTTDGNEILWEFKMELRYVEFR